MREPALGVHRAVDGIDDDEGLVGAEVDEAALLGHGGEARAGGVQAVELAEDRVLGGGVDDQRLVAAPAGLAGLDDALVARGVVRENLPQTLHGAPARAQPIEGEQLSPRVASGGHMPHILGACPIRSTASALPRARSPRTAGLRSSSSAPRARASRAPGCRATRGSPRPAAWLPTSSSPSPPRRRR